MEPKIPISCISNLTIDNSFLIYEIQCYACRCIYYEPVYSFKDNLIYCKNCFYKKNNIEICFENNIGKLYKNIDKNKLELLNKFKYYCPLCSKRNINNINENPIEYSYDSLISHLITCQNKIIFKKSCPNFYCDKNCIVYLKDIKQENLDNILLSINVLEKEIANEKLKINFEDYLNYQKEISSQENKKNLNIKNEFINKKRKNEKQETNSNKKNIGLKSKNNINKTKNSDNKEIVQIMPTNIEKVNSNNFTLVDICPHWKSSYKNIFSCCNKDYGCDECHFNNESHHLVYSGESLCLNCKQLFIGDKCPICKTEKMRKRK